MYGGLKLNVSQKYGMCHHLHVMVFAMKQERKSQVVELDIKEMSKNGTPLAFFWMLLGNAISCLSYFESNIYGTCVC